MFLFCCWSVARYINQRQLQPCPAIPSLLVWAQISLGWLVYWPPTTALAGLTTRAPPVPWGGTVYKCNPDNIGPQKRLEQPWQDWSPQFGLGLHHMKKMCQILRRSRKQCKISNLKKLGEEVVWRSTNESGLWTSKAKTRKIGRKIKKQEILRRKR